MRKRKSIFFTLILLLACQTHAFDLDETVDDDIRKNYNPDKLVNETIKSNPALNKANQSDDLPDLPSITKSPQYKTQTTSTNQAPKINISYSGGNTRIKDGTSIEVISSTSVSDTQKAGTGLSFTSKSIKNGKGFTIPAGTRFYGEIVETHPPQISCNGGLVVIKVNSMVYKGQTVPINAYITRANDKKIFFNNIKGKRTYLSTVYKKGNWGRTIFGRMLNLTINLGGDSSTLVLSPFPFLYGTICLGANTLLSPITAFFSKGGHVSIPANSNYKIKFIDDVWVD